MTAIESVSNLLGIRSGERRLVLLVFGVFFWAGMGRAFTSSGSYGLFLAHFNSHLIPYIYIVSGVIMALIMFGYLKLGGYLSLTQLVSANLGLCVAISFLLPIALLLGQPNWLIFALPVWYEGLVVLLASALWGFAGYMFTVRQGKRLFGIVASGLPLGFIVSGAVTPWLAKLFGSANLLLAAGVSIAVALALIAAIGRVFPAHLAAASAAATPKPPRNGKQGPLWRNRYILLIFAVLTLWTLAFFFVDNIFLDRVAARYPTATEVSAFMGVYSISRGVLMLLGGLFLTAPLLNRYGVRTGIMVLPIAIALGSLALVVPGLLLGLAPFLFWPAFATKLLMYAFDSTDRASLNIIYQPLPADLRARVPTIAEGVLQPVFTGVAGLLLAVLVVAANFSVVQLGVGLLIVVAGWLLAALTLGRSYPRMLMQALVRRRLGSEQVMLEDESSRAVLQAGLRSPNGDVVVYALNRLEETRDTALTAALIGLLDHPLPAVRSTVLERIERYEMKPALPAVRQRLAVEESAPVRGALVRTELALDLDGAFDTGSVLLADPEPEVRIGAAAGLMRHGSIGGVLAAGQQVLEWTRSAHVEDRIVAARVLGEVGDAHFYQPLTPLMSDPEPEVRNAALAAAGKLHNPKLWPHVAAGLHSPHTRQAASAALVAGGKSALPAIEAMLNVPALERETLLRLVTVCGRMRSPEACAVLARNVCYPNPQVRGAILQTLHRYDYHARSGPTANPVAVQEQLAAEAEDTAWTLAAQLDLGDDPALDLLRSALQIELDDQRTRILHLLSFLVQPSAVRRVQDILQAPTATADLRAYALEALDVVTPQEYKAIVLPLVDDLKPQQRLLQLNLAHPQLRLSKPERICAIAVDQGKRFSEWTAACALDAIGRLRLHQYYGVARQAQASDDPLICETSRRVVAMLDAEYASARLEAGAATQRAGSGLHYSAVKEERMLSIIERVIILKSVNIFNAVPDDTLAAVAAVLDEVECTAGERIFTAGDLGKDMYVIVAGRVRIDVDGQTVNELSARDVFGEMALLAAEPRSATVTAAEDTLLLKLNQEDFFDLFEDHTEIARGIILVLSQRLKARSDELAHLRASLDKGS